MGENEMWEPKYKKSVAEIQRLQDEMKMARLRMGEQLEVYAEAVKHLSGKSFKKNVREDCDMGKDKAYRHINVWKDLKWNPELVKGLKWSVLELIVNSDLPQDYKLALIKYAGVGLTNDQCKEIIKRWAKGEIDCHHPDWLALLQHKGELKEYNNRRSIEENGLVDLLETMGSNLTSMVNRNLTMDEAGKRRIDELVSLLTPLLKEFTNIINDNTVPPTFDPDQTV
ncbi:endonuclease Q family protein [bacterium]|nr:endonuclease Q family protein [bacterium]